MIDTYSMRDNAARCSECNRFMPWARSRQIEVDSGPPAEAPALVEKGKCARCDATCRGEK